MRLMLMAVAAALLTQVSSAPEPGSDPVSPNRGLTPSSARGQTQLLVVAQDGSGQFRTIQSALDTISQDNLTPKAILVKNGSYREKIFIKSSHVAIVGEDRDKTVIEYAELRKNWRVDHPDDWGAAVVNIADTASDIFLGNLTVHNNYGSLHGDRDHQFAIRSGGIATRIIIVHAKIVADGGDTLSLWNTGNGMYYHADCDFEGWVDYVCPRGWCYITNSRFFGRNLTASIWHDGSKDKDQKFVIRRSSFDGVEGFPLGRNNRDGQFFLLDNRFSANMANRPIYRPSAESAYQWPIRNYYWNNQRDAGNFAWFADNLESADDAPRARDITPAWTFQGRWDPEATLPAVLPFASTPRPEHGDRDVPAALTVLRWAGARDATKYTVAFGTSTPPIGRTEMNDTRYDAGRLTPGTTYYWRVDAVTPAGMISGPVWSFRVADRELRPPARSVGQKPRTAAPKGAGLAMPPAASAPPQPVTATPAEAATIRDERELNDSTIDNSATHTQLRYLARVFDATKQPRFLDAFRSGLEYLFAAQYRNGGWPQYYPIRANYSRYITFNDDAMIGAMRLLRDIGESRAPFGFVDEATRARARDATRRGTSLILKSQIRVGGALTGWCAQHDEQTLEPRDARAYEHASISGRESVEIVRFLMGIERPGADVIAAIEGAVAYLRSNQVRGLRLVEKPDPALPHGRDVVAVADPSAPPLWARFYQIGTNRPIYSGRDGVIRFNLSEIEVERRAGYSWLGPYAADLLDREYPAWKASRR